MTYEPLNKGWERKTTLANKWASGTLGDWSDFKVIGAYFAAMSVALVVTMNVIGG